MIEYTLTINLEFAKQRDARNIIEFLKSYSAWFDSLGFEKRMDNYNYRIIIDFDELDTVFSRIATFEEIMNLAFNKFTHCDFLYNYSVFYNNDDYTMKIASKLYSSRMHTRTLENYTYSLD